MEKGKQETTVNDGGSNGVRKWRNKFVEMFTGSKSFCLILCIIIFGQSMATSGMLTASLRDLEKQFGFTSKQTGFILISNDIAALIAVPIVSFFGEKGNKPRWIFWGSLLCAVGSIGMALPKFLAGTYILPGTNSVVTHGPMCEISNSTMDYCIHNTAIANNVLYLLVFVMAQVILGIGATPLLTLGVSYLDENVDPHSSPIYMGIIYTASFVGSTSGLIITGFFLKTFVEIDLPPGVSLDVNDQLWIGAWWIGFVVVSAVLFVFAFAFHLFPQGIKESQLKREEAIASGLLKGKDENITMNVRGFLAATKDLLRNKAYVIAVIGVTSATVFGAGFGSAFPKFLILKFGASTDLAGIASGAAIMPAMFAGIMIGSFIMRRLPLKNSIETAAKICTCISYVIILLCAVFMIPGCKEPNIVGAVLPYQNVTGKITVSAPCNEACSCDRSAYRPGCGSDGKTYFSPCFAGCMTKINEKVYANCSCIPGKTDTLDDGKLFNGECERDCKNLYLFLAALCVLGVLAFLKATPHKMIILRAVPENQRSYALGVQLVIVRLLGFIPSPILIGTVIDSNCALWAKSACGELGSCIAYRNYEFSKSMVVFSVITSTISALAYSLVWYFLAKMQKSERQKMPEELIASNETISTRL